MKASEGTKDEKAVTGEAKQDNDASLNEVRGDPRLAGRGFGHCERKYVMGYDQDTGASRPGEGSDIANGSMSWDMTKTQESVDQVLKVYPSMASGKARALFIGNGLRRLC